MTTFLAHEGMKREAVLRTVQAFTELANQKDLDLPATEVQRLTDLLAKAASIPPDFAMGQLALPCFALAKTFRMAPAELATALAEKINQTIAQESAAPASNKAAASKLVASASAVAGFLNMTARFDQLAKDLVPRLLDDSLFASPLHSRPQPERIVVEYSQPNTHKALHVGHLRCLVLGDAVSNLLAAAGHEVIRVTYPGDMGAHIAKTLWFLKNHHQEPAPATHRGDWLGDLYATAHAFIEDASKDPAQGESIKKAIGGVLAELQNGSGPYYELWQETREWSFTEMRSVYDWMGVTFDEWFTESQCDAPSRELVLQKEREGLFVRDQGAIGIDLSPWKLGFALLLKSDGNGLYLTKDLELIRRKFSDPKVTRSIVVVDARQKLHFRQVFKIAELMGYPQAAASAHLDYETVNTADGKQAFSSRTKNGMKLFELKRLMEEKVTKDYLERYRSQWNDDDIQKTASLVTVGAIKYGMLKVDNNTQVHFDIAEWLRLDGDTGPYLQYVHARCLNILDKQAGTREVSQGTHSLAFDLTEDIEKDLLVRLARYFDALRQGAELLRPTFVAAYLFDLAKTFNRFYEQCSIKESAGDVRATRLALVAATAKVMERGLGVLGIPAPDRM
jgi:arginyl-tRNA synthetase